MAWKQSVAQALASLRVEEARLARELASTRERIAALSRLGGKGGASAGRIRRPLSAKARASIVRAQKARWAKWRKEQKKA